MLLSFTCDKGFSSCQISNLQSRCYDLLMAGSQVGGRLPVVHLFVSLRQLVRVRRETGLVA